MRRVIWGVAAALSAMWGGTALGKIHTEIVGYTVGGQVMQGYLSYDDADDRPRPGVVVCPEWWGCNEYARTRAEMLATMGYIAVAIDMYGKDKVTTDAKQAGAWAGEVFGDPKTLRERAAAGMKVLTDHKLCDKGRVAAIGYCMGGTVALELARTGAELKAVVAFHASTVSAKDEADNKNIKARVLVCHGADDTFVKPGELDKFQKQMKDAKVDYVLVAYAGAVHAFTNPNADKAGLPGVAYNANADKRSWAHMRTMFDEVFAAKR